MRLRAFLLCTVLAACASQTPTETETGGKGGSPGAGGKSSGGSPGSGGSGPGGTAGATTGSGGAGNTPAGSGGATGGSDGQGGSAGSAGGPADGGAGGGTASPADAGSAGDQGGSAAGGSEGGGMASGTALLVVGKVPPIGDDTHIEAELKARGLKVELVQDTMAATSHAEGKQLVVLSYSLDSDNLMASKFADVPVPVIVMEHALLEGLGMTGKDHSWVKPATQITITAADSPLAAGLSGDVTVYGAAGSVFWGQPSAGAIKVASVKGQPAKSVIFAYPKGAMMTSKPAPAKRLQFFLGGHLVPERFLNPSGIKLLAAAITWSVAP